MSKVWSVGDEVLVYDYQGNWERAVVLDYFPNSHFASLRYLVRYDKTQELDRCASWDIKDRI